MIPIANASPLSIIMLWMVVSMGVMVGAEAVLVRRVRS